MREIRKCWFRVMLKKKVPKQPSHYGIKWVCEVMQCTASTSGDLSGRTALEQLTGETPEFQSTMILPFMTGAGIMSMLGWVKRNWADGVAFPIVLVV